MASLENLGYVAALRIVRRLRELGHAAYLAGGCVRDLLLRVEAKDFDVATSATPELVMAAFARTEAVGAHFGVVLVIEGHGEERVATEVATFRHDGAYSDGRRPDAVRFSGDPREDVLRRDFTINGLLLDAVRFDEGDRLEDCVLDFVGGRADLEAGVVRAIGEPERRFAEDKLRMLRAVRFAARLGFAIEPKTMRAIEAQAAEVGVVSAERVREELTKILTEGGARRGLELLEESGLLAVVLPEIAKMQGVEQPPQFHPEGDVWVHTLMLLEHLGKNARATLAWGMLLHDAGKPATFTPPDPAKAGDRIRFNGHVEVGVAVARAILNRLRFSTDEAEQILALVKHHMQFGDVMLMKQSTLKRFLRLPQFEEHLALHYADVMSSNGKTGLYEFAKARYEAMGEEEIRPKLLLTGAELIAAGYKPGPGFKAMLTAAEDAQLEGEVTTIEEALAMVRERFGRRSCKVVRFGARELGDVMDFDVAVLGAGMAGLTAARALGERGLRVCVIEAQERVGGRMLSQTLESGGVVELGAEFVHGRVPELWALIDEAGVETVEREGTMVREGWGGGIEEDDPQDGEMFAPLEELETFEGEDISFWEWLKRSDVPKLERQALLGYVEGFNAADARRIGVKSLGAQQKAEDATEGDSSWHVVGGYAQLTEYLAAKVKELGGEMRLGCAVVGVRWGEDEVCVETTLGDVNAQQCVVALPLGVLQRVNMQDELWMEPEPAAIEAARRLEMGDAERFTMVFKERWWAEAEVLDERRLQAMHFLFTPQRMPPVWWTAHPEQEMLPTLTGWVGGPKAKAWRGTSGEELGAAACAELAEAFGVEKAIIREALVATHRHDWAGDPWSRGAYSYVPVGAMGAPAAMAIAEGRMVFAGEHTDVTGHWGTVHAALRSGLRAAEQILKEV